MCCRPRGSVVNSYALSGRKLCRDKMLHSGHIIGIGLTGIRYCMIISTSRISEVHHPPPSSINRRLIPKVSTQKFVEMIDSVIYSCSEFVTAIQKKQE